MSIYTVLFLFSISTVHAISRHTSANKQDYNFTASDVNNINTEFSMEEKLKKIRIETIKFQLLAFLNMKDASPSRERSTEESNEIIRLLIKEDEEEEWRLKPKHLFNSKEHLVIHAKQSNMRCLYTNVTDCRMHHFELSQSLNASSVDLWVYKLTENPELISISVSSSTSTDKKQYEVIYFEADHAGWNKLQFPNVLTPPLWNHSSYTIEIIGQTVEYTGEHRPFLLVSKLAFIPTRQRREVECNANESCCWRSFRISFADLGFDRVVYPSELEANFCMGRCLIDPSTVRTHYERSMLKILETENTVKDSLDECWTIFCKPTSLESVRVLFYNDANGVIHDQYIPYLSVKSCGCS